MKGNQKGFTLLEVLIAIAILGIIMAMNSTLLQEMIRGTRQQSAIVSSQFETALGLEILRNDLGNAGFGVPDSFSAAINYTEPAADPASQCNDSPSGIPRSIVLLDGALANNAHSYDSTYLNNSDYLVIKSPAVGMNKAAGKWTYMTNAANNYVRVWGEPNLDMEAGNRMIVIRARSSKTNNAQLIINGLMPTAPKPFFATYFYDGDLSDGTTLNGDEDDVGGFRPPDPPTGERYIVYGVDDDTNLRRPFNRADYYVRKVSGTTGLGCAPGTGTLFKAVADQGDDNRFSRYAILDCVANMQVEFGLDTDLDGTVNTTTSTLPSAAIDIKSQVKEIRVYILTHEGTLDRGYHHDTNTMVVGPINVDLTTLVTDGNWDHYRWKLYTLFVKPRSFY
jgi:prepilin-type N-terminal cleavage/methylation domain-containing protein